jgi:hypothetical protein
MEFNIDGIISTNDRDFRGGRGCARLTGGSASDRTCCLVLGLISTTAQKQVPLRAYSCRPLLYDVCQLVAKELLADRGPRRVRTGREDDVPSRRVSARGDGGRRLSCLCVAVDTDLREVETQTPPPDRSCLVVKGVPSRREGSINRDRCHAGAI